MRKGKRERRVTKEELDCMNEKETFLTDHFISLNH